MISKALATISLFLATTSLMAQDVNPYAPGGLTEGVVYYLPKTQLKIKVTATRTAYTPGDLCQYAEHYLRLKGISSKPSIHWEIQSIQVTPIGIPDTTKAYSIKLKDKSAMSQVDLTENGIIKAINTTAPSPQTTVEDKKDTPKKPQHTDPRKFMTEEMMLAGSSNKTAELIASEIYQIRESKNSLNRGQADYMPQDGSALRIMLDNLEEQETALTSLFAGVTDTSSHSYTYYIYPEQEMDRQVIFRFSKKLGILKENDLAGEPIYLSIVDEHILPPATEETQRKRRPDGIIYNIPGKGTVTINSMDKVYYQKKLPITQFGETEILISQLFNKKINTKVIFNPTTGGISQIDRNE